MPVLPVDGAYYFPETHEWAASMTADVSGVQDGASGRAALDVRGVMEYPKLMSLSVGLPSTGRFGASLDAGSPAQGRSGLGLTVAGPAPSRAGMSATIAPEPSAYRAALAADVISSEVHKFPARMGLSVNGAAISRHARMSLTVNQQTVRPARQSLVVRDHLDNAARMSADIGILWEPTMRMSLDVAQMDGFLILANIVSPALLAAGQLAAGYFPPQDVSARLLVGDDEVAIKSFTYQEPRGTLGSILNVTLSDAVRTLAPTNSDIRFDIIVWDADGTERYVTLIDTGKIAGRGYTIQWAGRGPGDELTISGLDVLADRFDLAPRQPIIMFDPTYVKFSDVMIKTRDMVLTEKGIPIQPSFEPNGALSMMTALQRAYTKANGFQFMTRLTDTTFVGIQSHVGTGPSYSAGLGFDKVVTNIPNYPITRCDFSLEMSWHDAVKGIVEMYGPIYFVEDNVLFVIDAYKALPAGHTPRIVTLDEYSKLGYEQPYRTPYNAVLLRYQQRGFDELTGWGLREVTQQTTSEPGGAFGTLSYQRVETIDTTRQKYLLEDPDNTIDEQPLLHEVRTYAHKVQPLLDSADGGEAHYTLVPGDIIQVSREVQQDRYNEMGLKVGHHKEVYGLVDRAAFFGVGPSDAEPILIASEDCSISWIVNPNDPAQMIQDLNFTIYEGLVYESTSTSSKDGDEVQRRYPVIAAQASPGIIKDDGRMFYGPLRTVTEKLRRTKGNQLDVLVTERDLVWTGTVRETVTAPRTGSRSTNPYEIQGRTLLLRDLVSEAAIGPRVPASVNAGELTRIRALELGHRALELGPDPPPEPQITFPGLDFAIRKGSVVKGEYRDSTFTEPIIVEARSITGENLGVPGHHIFMTVEGTELVV